MRFRRHPHDPLGGAEQVERPVCADSARPLPVDAQQLPVIVENLNRYGRSMLWCSLLLDENDHGLLRRRP